MFRVISKSIFDSSEIAHRPMSKSEAEALASKINDSGLNRVAKVVEVK